MSADLDALDRGLVELGAMVAEDRARLERLEGRVGAIFTMMRQLTAEAGYAVSEDPAHPPLRAVR